MTLQSQLRDKRLVVFLGAGGVGKTTIAAACAVQAARERETLALTIDPARRLADALGVRLGAGETRVEGRLSAAMLDSKQALDDMVRKYAPDQERLQRIMASPFYAQLSDAFAGSEEFVASGQLYELLQQQRYELVVVDTPPSKHALDFLEVPERLVKVFDSGAVSWLFKPTRLLRLAGGRATALLARWTSQRYIEDVADFFTQFDRMFLDMEQRVRAMRGILTDPAQTAIAIVALPEPASMLAARTFHRELTERLRMPVDAIVVNRVLTNPPPQRGVSDEELARLLAKALEHSGTVPRAHVEPLSQGVVRGASLYRAMAQHQQEAIRALASEVACEVVQVPALPESVSSLAGLEKLRAAMFG
ncbi:MAG: PhoH family protein [Halobacteriales archaeon]|nr:PhoH family protein [Halobacteriales archaeon]